MVIHIATTVTQIVFFYCGNKYSKQRGMSITLRRYPLFGVFLIIKKPISEWYVECGSENRFQKGTCLTKIGHGLKI